MLWQKKRFETSSLPLSLGSRLPELLAQKALQDLPRRIPRDLRDELHAPPRLLEARQLALAVREDVRFRQQLRPS